jgi:isoleucyl-tRNA synthetase
MICSANASVVDLDWTTTPWTIPATAPSPIRREVAYGLYEVGEAQNDFGPRPGEKLIFAKALAEDAEFAKGEAEVESSS